MVDLFAQGDQPGFDWGNLIYLALLALGGLTELIRRWAGKKSDDSIEAEIEEDAPPSRPVSRPPSTATARPASARPAERPISPVVPQRPVQPRPVQPRSVAQRPAAPVATARPVPVRPGHATPPFRTPPQSRPVPATFPSPSVRPAPTQIVTQSEPTRPPAEAVSSVRSQTPPAISTDFARLTADRTSLQQAVILAEILAPPVALRQPGMGMHFSPSWD